MIMCWFFLFIQGDSDIPAGRVSFEVDLCYCMYLNQEMQTDMQSIDHIEAVTSNIALLERFATTSAIFGSTRLWEAVSRHTKQLPGKVILIIQFLSRCLIVFITLF